MTTPKISKPKVMTPKDNELAIVRAILETIAMTGHEFAISYERGYDRAAMVWTRDVDEAMKHAHACDEEHIMVSKGFTDHLVCGWVHLIYGNGNHGFDVVADYTINLSGIIDPILESLPE